MRTSIVLIVSAALSVARIASADTNLLARVEALERYAAKIGVYCADPGPDTSPELRALFDAAWAKHLYERSTKGLSPRAARAKRQARETEELKRRTAEEQKEREVAAASRERDANPSAPTVIHGVMLGGRMDDLNALCEQKNITVSPGEREKSNLTKGISYFDLSSAPDGSDGVAISLVVKAGIVREIDLVYSGKSREDAAAMVEKMSREIGGRRDMGPLVMFSNQMMTGHIRFSSFRKAVRVGYSLNDLSEWGLTP